MLEISGGQAIHDHVQQSVFWILSSVEISYGKEKKYKIMKEKEIRMKVLET